MVQSSYLGRLAIDMAKLPPGDGLVGEQLGSEKAPANTT